MALPAGARLGPYEILSPIGAGGMGEVYRARDRKLDRDVAIKVLPDAVASDPDRLARFEREAKAIAALSHPNILAIFDFGNHDGIAYAVTELLDGETLRRKLDAGPIPSRQVLDYALQIVKGLSTAHQGGIVHRDLKPENVLVTTDGHVKILDFGLAKKVDTGSVDSTSTPTEDAYTQPGTVMGTPAYMSPEQVRGLAVDHRSDIFSFGAVFYELLSGRKAFGRDTVGDTVAAILKEEPPALPADVGSPALDHIARHCLEKDRNNRFQSAKDLAFALGQTSSSPMSAVTYASPGRWKILVATLGVAVLVSGALFYARWPPRRAEGSTAPKRLAVLPFENLGAPDDGYFADGVADAIRGKLASLSGVEVIARASSTSYRKTNKTPSEIGKELDVKYLLTATVRWEKRADATSRVQVSPELVEIGSDPPTLKWEQPFDAGMTDVFQVQSEIATRVAQALGVELGAPAHDRLASKPTQSVAAYDAFLKGEEAYREEDNDTKSVPFYEQAVALDPGFEKAWVALTLASAAAYGTETQTPDLAERARQALERVDALAPASADSYLALGHYMWLVKGDQRAAVEAFTKADQLAPGDADVLVGRGASHVLLGQWQLGLDDYRRAERLNPRSPDPKEMLGWALLFMRRYPEARAALDQALALAPQRASTVLAKATWFVMQGDLPAAQAVMRAAPLEPTARVVFTATGIGPWILDERERDILTRLTPSAFSGAGDRPFWGLSLARAYALRGDTASARRFAEQATTSIEALLRAAPQHPGDHAMHGLALAYLGRTEEAVREGQRALELSPSKSGLMGVGLQGNLAVIYVVLGERQEAFDLLEQLQRVPSTLSPGWLRIDPTFDSLRDDPRFRKIVASAK